MQPNNGHALGRLTPARIATELRTTARALLAIADALDGGGAPPSPGRSLPPSPGGSPPASKPREAPPLGERLTSRQLGAIRAMSRRAGLSRGELTELLHDAAGVSEPALLTRSAASEVLDRLSARAGYR